MRVVRASRNPGLLAISLTVAFCCGCSVSSSAPPPEISAAQFHLELHAEWGELRRGLPIFIEHRLSNHSQFPVCVGGNQTFLLGGRRSQSTVSPHSFCKSPLEIVPAGGTAVWVVAWTAPAGCLEDAEVDAGFSRAFPLVICGGEAALESEISLFRMRGNRSDWGEITVVSKPQTVKLTPQRQSAE